VFLPCDFYTFGEFVPRRQLEIMKNVEDRKRFEYGMLRQMDIQNASYPDQVGNETDLTPIVLARMIMDSFPRLFGKARFRSLRIQAWIPGENPSWTE
jgi:hypothetical protein